MRLGFTALGCVAIALCCATAAHAQTNTFNVANGDWNDANNWNPAEVPVSTGTADIRSSRTATVSSGSSAEVGTILMAWGVGGGGNLNVDGSLAAQNVYMAQGTTGLNSAQATLNVGTTGTMAIANLLKVGGANLSSATVNTAGALSANTLEMAYGSGGTAYVNASGTNASINVAGSVLMGQGPTGLNRASAYLTVMDGAVVTIGGNVTQGSNINTVLATVASGGTLEVGGSLAVPVSIADGTVRANSISGGGVTAAAGMLAPWDADATVSAPLTLTGTSFTFDSADKDGVGRTLTASNVNLVGPTRIVKSGAGTVVIGGISGSHGGGADIEAGTLRFDLSTAANLTGTISGAGSFQKSGAGLLALTAANTYNGTTTLTGGTLSITSDANIGGTAAPLVFDGGTLGIAGTSLTSLAAGRTTSFAATKTVGFAVADAANTFTVGQALDQTTGGLAVSGAGTLVLAGANTFTGAASVTGGGLRLDYTTSDTSKLSDTAALTLTGAALTLAGGSHTEAVGSTTLAAGRTTVSRDGGSSTLRLGAVTRNSGAVMNVAEPGIVALNTTNTSGIVGGWLTVAGNDWGVNATNGANGAVNALPGASYFTSTSGSLGASGTNTTVGASGTYGTTTINSLRFADAAAYTVTGSAASTLTISSGGLLVASGVGTNTSTITGATLTAGASNLMIHQHNTSGALAIDSVVGGSGGVFKTGAGALSLGGSGTNTFTGGLSVYEGEVQLAKSGSGIAVNSGTVTIGQGGAIRYTGASTNMIANAVAIQLNGSGFLDFAGATDTVGAVTVNATNAGADAQVLRNTGSGGTLTVSSLTITPDNGYVTTLDSGSGLLALGGNTTFNASGSGQAVIAGGLSLGNGNRTFTVNDGLAADDLTISAAISNGTLTKAGAGTLVLSSSNAHTMTLSAGQLNLGHQWALGTGTFTITGGTIVNSSGAALTVAGNNVQAWNGNFTVDGPDALDLGTGSVTLSAARTVTINGPSLTVGGSIGGAALLTKSGTGTLTLGGGTSNTFSGLTVNAGEVLLAKTGAANAVGAGTVTVNAGGSVRYTGDSTDMIADARPITLNNSGYLDFNGQTDTVGALTIAASAAGASVQSIRNTGAGGTFTVASLAITPGDGYVTTLDSGSGLLALGGNTTFNASGSGRAVIAGSLSLGNGNRTFTVNDGLAADDLTISAAISNGTLVKAGAGTLVLSGSNNFTSGTFNEVDVRNGTLRLAASGGETLGLGTQVTVGSGLGPATLDLANAPQTLASLRFSGSAGTVVGGGAEGDLKLSNNGAAATVAVLDGTAHDIQSAVTLDAATTFDVAIDGRLKLSGAISSTAFGLTKTGQGVLELSGANAYQGITEIQAGTLLINGSTIANSAISVSSGAVLGGNGIIGGNLTLASGAFLAFDTASTLTLNGSLTLDSSFGVGSLRDLNGNAINWDSIEEGTYTLMNTSFTFDDLNISNFGFANRTPVAAGKYAYFENGSLELEVVPEPTTLALASLGAALAVWMARRRRR